MKKNEVLKEIIKFLQSKDYVDEYIGEAAGALYIILQDLGDTET